MQLREAEAVGVLDDQRVDVRDVDARLDDRRADEDVDLALHEVPPDRGQLLLGHLAVGDADPRLGHEFVHLRGAVRDALDIVVQVVDLAAPAQLLLDGLGDDARVVLEHERLDRVAIHGCLFDDRHVADAAHRHIQSPRDGRRRQGQDVHVRELLFEFFFLRDAEPLFLVDDEEAEVPELHVLRDEPVCADEDVDVAPADPVEDLLLLGGRAEAGEHLDFHREALEPLHNGVVVLEREDSRRHEDGALFPVGDALEGGA